MRTTDPICLEKYSEYPDLGRFVLRKEKFTQFKKKIMEQESTIIS